MIMQTFSYYLYLPFKNMRHETYRNKISMIYIKYILQTTIYIFLCITHYMVSVLALALPTAQPETSH